MEKVLVEGTLQENDRGRWEILADDETMGEFELTCGSCVDVCVGDSLWISGRIEASGGKYLFLCPDGRTAITLREGLPARA